MAASLVNPAECKGEVVNDKLYVVGGYNGAVSDQLDIYDLTVDNSPPTSITMPIPNSANAVTAIDDIIYIIGDFANLSYVASYNTVTEQFKVYESNLNPRRHAAVESIGNTLWVMGGNTESDITSSLDDVQYTDVLSSNNAIELDYETIISPNPARNFLRFSIPVHDIKIVNNMGILIRSIEGNHTEINISNLTEGIYYIIGRSDKGLISQKWIKQ